MRTCFIHIGFHKTGTTSLQKWLLANRMLLERHGYTVPESGLSLADIAAHHNIAFEVSRDDRFKPAHGTMRELAGELSIRARRHAILSSEDFSLMTGNPVQLAKLRDPIVALGYRIVWIAYLRWAPAWIDSAYAELVKQLSIGAKFDEWYGKPESSTRFAHILNPNRVFDPLFATGDEVHVRSFTMAQETGLTADFLTVLGLPADTPGFVEPPRENERSPMLAIEFFRRLAWHIKCEGLLARKREFVMRSWSEQGRLPPSPPFVGMTDAIAAEIDKASAAAYQGILSRCRQDAGFRAFFATKAFHRCEYDANTATESWEQSLREACGRTLGALLGNRP